VTQLLRPLAAGVIGAVGVAIARDDLTRGPWFVAAAAVLVLLCVLVRERGVALAALGIGAAGAFGTPDGLGPLFVVAGVVVACEVAAIDGRLGEWRDVIDAAIALPALAGLAATVAAQPSQRGIVLGAVAAAAVGGAALRPPSARPRSGDLLLLSAFGALGAFVVALGPDRVPALGDVPTATAQAARSLSYAFAVFVLVQLVGALQAERRASRPVPRRRASAAHAARSR
jgi:hypothetical protein